MVEPNPYASPSFGTAHTAKLPDMRVLFVSVAAFGVSLTMGAILGGCSGSLKASISNFYVRKLGKGTLFDESEAMLRGAWEGLLYGAAVGMMAAALSAIVYLVRRRLKNAVEDENGSS